VEEAGCNRHGKRSLLFDWNSKPLFPKHLVKNLLPEGRKKSPPDKSEERTPRPRQGIS
jgi:hypothetical protein